MDLYFSFAVHFLHSRSFRSLELTLFSICNYQIFFIQKLYRFQKVYYLGVCCRTAKLKLPLLADGGLTTSSLPPLVPLVTGNTWKKLKEKLRSNKKSNTDTTISQGGYYRPQRSCGKVMFLHPSVILSTKGGVWQTPPQETATAVDSTHPTGMHSCYSQDYHESRAMILGTSLFSEDQIFLF